MEVRRISPIPLTELIVNGSRHGHDYVDSGLPCGSDSSNAIWTGRQTVPVQFHLHHILASSQAFYLNQRHDPLSNSSDWSMAMVPLVVRPPSTLVSELDNLLSSQCVLIRSLESKLGKVADLVVTGGESLIVNASCPDLSKGASAASAAFAAS